MTWCRSVLTFEAIPKYTLKVGERTSLAENGCESEFYEGVMSDDDGEEDRSQMKNGKVVTRLWNEQIYFLPILVVFRPIKS